MKTIDKIKTIDKVIEYIICSIMPFVFVILGVLVGIKIGSLFTFPEDLLYPKVIGGVLGFLIFGMIGRFVWTESHDNNKKQNGKKRKSNN